MSSWNQEGITGSGREPVNQPMPGDVDYLAASTSDDGCFEQPSSTADALRLNKQASAPNGGQLQ